MAIRILTFVLAFLLSVQAANADIYLIFTAGSTISYKTIDSSVVPVPGAGIGSTDVVLDLTTGATGGDLDPSHYINNAGALVYVPSASASQTSTPSTAAGYLREIYYPSLAQIVGIIKTPPGDVWATDASGGIDKFSPNYDKIFYPTIAAHPNLITYDSFSDALIYTNFVDNKIGVMSLTGIPVEYSITTSSSGAQGLCGDGAGHIAFCEYSANKIGIFNTTTHAITEFATGITSGHPNGITFDGTNFWYTDIGADHIVKMSVAGSMLNTYSTGSHPNFITFNGTNLYFTVSGIDNYIVKSNLSGSQTSYPIPTPGSSAQFICVDSNSNLEFTETAANKIGIMTPTGIFLNELTIPTNSSAAQDICNGLNGNANFCESTSGRLGEIVLGTSNQSTVLTQVYNGTTTDIAGSAGDLFWNMPDQSTTTKSVALNFVGYTAAGTTTITFPTAFTNTPTITSNTAGVTVTTLSTTQIVIPAVTTVTGGITIEGF